MIGQTISHYRISEKIGSGGMGVVYRARDERLKRDVALKVLPELVARDAERMVRFEREAQVLASLNHPNIASIYGLEESEGICALLMELVEGPPLADRLKSGPIPIEEALPIARQIAEALEAAHERGIIHRDLKPANIKVTPEGTVKVLDFGLAKALESQSSTGNISDANISDSPTLSSAATQAGVILGTAAYMSPEQARGKPVDKRADVWAFGCVLYEVLTGKKVFEGETVSDVLAAVIRAEADWAALPVATPPKIRRLLARSLNKDSKQRLRDIGEARIAIEETLSGADSAAVAVTSASPGVGTALLRGRALLWSLAALAALSTAALLWTLLLRPPPPPERMEFAIPVQAEVSSLALSADGQMLAFAARDDASDEDVLYVQRIGSRKASLLAGTDGAYYPFWSPDGADVAFFAGGKLKKVAIAGGPPQVIAEATSGRGGAWGKRGVIIYSPDAGGPLWRVNADGTNSAPLTATLFVSPEGSHRWPVFLSDGDRFLFLAGSFTTANRTDGIYVSSLAATEKKLLVPARSNSGYFDGHLFYVDDKRELIVVSVDAPHARVRGEPQVLAEGVAYQPSVYWGAFTAGGNGTVVYNTSTATSLSALTWYDRSGKELGKVGEPGVLANPSISPDGTHAVVDVADLKANNVDVWIDDLKRKTSARFTFDPAEEETGVWSRDGGVLAYRLLGDPGSQLLIKNAAGLAPGKPIFTIAQGDILPNSWTPDDKQILCSLQPSAGGSDLVLIDLSNGKKVPFLAGKANETNGQISPDGKWVAYASNETGDWETYVTTFPNPMGKWQVSRGGGTEPRWRGDGREIFYIGAKGTLTAVEVSTKGVFSSGAPSPLFQLHGRAPISSSDLFTYDVARDGKRFLVNRYVKPDHVQPLTVVLNAVADVIK